MERDGTLNLKVVKFGFQESRYMFAWRFPEDFVISPVPDTHPTKIYWAEVSQHAVLGVGTDAVKAQPAMEKIDVSLGQDVIDKPVGHAERSEQQNLGSPFGFKVAALGVSGDVAELAIEPQQKRGRVAVGRPRIRSFEGGPRVHETVEAIGVRVFVRDDLLIDGLSRLLI